MELGLWMGGRGKWRYENECFIGEELLTLTGDVGKIQGLLW